MQSPARIQILAALHAGEAAEAIGAPGLLPELLDVELLGAIDRYRQLLNRLRAESFRRGLVIRPSPGNPMATPTDVTLLLRAGEVLRDHMTAVERAQLADLLRASVWRPQDRRPSTSYIVQTLQVLLRPTDPTN